MIKYVVNVDEGVVVAHFEGGRNYWRNSILNKVYKLIRPYVFITVPHKILDNLVDDVLSNYPNLFGKAKTHLEHDTFDLEVGKKLAHDRLLDKYNRAENIVVTKVIKSLSHEYNELMGRV